MRFYKAPSSPFRVLSLAFALLIAGGLQAQNERQFKFGGQLGLGTSQISNSGFNGFHRSGLIVGGFFSQKLGENTAWQVELSFQQKGARDSSNIAGMRVHELVLPVVYRYFIGPIAFEGGLGLDVHLGATRSDVSVSNLDISDAFRRMGLSAIAGVSYHLNERIWVSFRLQNSILPIQAGSIPGGIGPSLQVGGGGWRHSVLSATAYYSFW